MSESTTTIFARLTPPGRAAIACLGVAGLRAWEIVRGLARRTLPETPKVGAVFVSPLGDAGWADEVVIVCRGPEDIEIHCHGGPEIVRLIESAFETRGATLASAVDWDRRRVGADAAELHELLAKCLTVRTAGIVLDQVAGAFDRAAVDPANHERLRRLIAVGAHVATPWTVALAGPPNVGKSSLVNALAGFARSLVSETPGTTRDVVSTMIALDGWPIALVDTAGLREAPDELEELGIARGRAAAGAADLVLRVADATGEAPGVIAAGEMLVVNKIDCAATWDLASRPEGVLVSAKTGEGLERLMAAIVSRLVPEAPRAGEGVPVTRKQISRVAPPEFRL